MALRKPLDHFIDLDLTTTSSHQFDLVNCKLLGSGLSGDVFLIHSDPHGSVALKRFKTNDDGNSSSFSSSCLESNIRMFKTEVNVMRICHHPNLMSLISSSRLADSLCITMPYMSGGSLSSVIKDLTLPRTVRYFFQIVDAVTYLHDKKIIHGDIKPGNVLISGDDQAVLTDFGLSRCVPNHSVEVFVNQGTRGYLAPETRGCCRVNPFKVDMYALGMTLWQMTIKKSPRNVDDHMQLVRQENLTPSLTSLLECLLQDEPSLRASAAQVASGHLP